MTAVLDLNVPYSTATNAVKIWTKSVASNFDSPTWTFAKVADDCVLRRRLHGSAALFVGNLNLMSTLADDGFSLVKRVLQKQNKTVNEVSI